MSFANYGLSPELLSGLADVRIEEPTPLQQDVIPEALQGRNLFVMSQQQDAHIFLIPALQKLVQKGEVTGTNVLILTPTIERAKALDEMIWAMGYHAQISSALVEIKGDKATQEEAVLNGAPVIVANPGRLIEILERKNHHLKHLDLLILDDADALENHSLVNRVRDILRFISSEPQTIMVASRENKATDDLAKALLKDPLRIGFSSNGSAEDPAAAVDMDEVQEKLEETEVEVVLDPETEENEQPTESAFEKPDEEDVKKKLEKVSVKVVLDPETKVKETPESESSETGDQQEQPTDTEDSDTEVDLGQAKEKLKSLGVKVVLKEDRAPEEEAEDGEVEPVYANPVLQGKKTTVPPPVTKGLEQGYINVPPRMKISTLMAHLEASPAKKVIAFAASSRTTDRLFRIIRKKDWGVVSISDDNDASTREERYSKFISGEVRILLVGGLSAKDIDIDVVQEVINYDVPSEVEEYRYRAELVGRGKATQIISLVSKMDRNDIKRITDEVGYPPTELPLPEELVEKKSRSKKKEIPTDKKRDDRGKGRGKKPARKKAASDNDRRGTKKLELPRPTYDGLSGGREGKPKKEKGLIGWIKGLFD